MISYLPEACPVAREPSVDIRVFNSSSAALTADHHRAFDAMFGIDIGIDETIGLTETEAPALSLFNSMAPHLRWLGAVGRASGCEARSIDVALDAVPGGSTGELAIAGPHVMRGYYKNDDATRAAFMPDGWLRTGDLSQRDADGFFVVTGHIRELVINGGENVASRETGEALPQHPTMREAAALGAPDRHYGQDICACIVLRDGAACNETELRAFCEGILRCHKAPRHFGFDDDATRGSPGNVQSLKLAPLFE